MKNQASKTTLFIAFFAGLAFWSCSLPWTPPELSQGAKLRITVKQDQARGLGLVVPSPALSEQITGYRLTVGALVRTGLTESDLAVQSGLPEGDQSILLEALKDDKVIMTHTAVTETLKAGVETPLDLTLTGLQSGAAAALMKIRFNLDSSLGTGPEGPVSEVKILVADSIANLGVPGGFTSVSLGAPQEDPLTGQEFVEWSDTATASGRWFAKVQFYGQKGTAVFAYAPILTLDLYDYAEHSLEWTLTGNELDGKPLAPTPPKDPVNAGSFLPVESASHDGTFLTLSWEDNSWVEEGFSIYRRLDSETDYTLVGSVDANVTTWSEPSDINGDSTTGLLRDQTYYYRITAHTLQWASGEPLEVGPLVTSPKAVLYVDKDLEGPWGEVYDYTGNPVDSPRGPHIIGSTISDWKLAVYNAGFWPLSITDITFGGDHDLDYALGSPEAFYDYDWSIDDTGPARADQAYPQKVVPGDVLFVQLVWDPQAPGIRSTQIFLATDDPQLFPTATGDNFITIQGEAADIDDYAGRWDLVAADGGGQIVGSSPSTLTNRNTAIPVSLEIGGFQSQFGDRFSLPGNYISDIGSFAMAGNNTDYLQVASGHPFDLDTGGTITFWAGLYFPKANETWTLLNTMDDMAAPTRGFALELVTNIDNIAMWRLKAAGSSGVTVAYAGELDYRWNLVSLEYDSVNSAFTLKVNGTAVLTTAQTLTSSAGDTIGWGSRPFEATDARTGQWRGSLDDLRIYSRLLSGTELTLLMEENFWVPDTTAPLEADSAGVNRAFPGATGGRFFLKWDTSSQPVGEVFRIQVELTPMAALKPRLYRIVPSALVNGEFVLEDPGYSPAVGNTFDITFRTMDWHGNLSDGIAYTGLTVQNPGSATGTVELDAGNFGYQLSSSYFYAVPDSGELFQAVGEDFREALPSSTSISDEMIHGAVGQGSGITRVYFGGTPYFESDIPTGCTFLTVYLRFNPGAVASAEWLLDGGTPVAAEVLRDLTYDISIDNSGNFELRDVVATPVTLLTAAGLATGHHTLTLRVTDQKGRIFSGSASFEVEE